MTILQQINEHLLLSFFGISNTVFWRNVVLNYYGYLPVFLFLLFVLGIVIAFRISLRNSFFYFIYKKFSWLVVFLLLCVSSGFSLLYFSSMAVYYFIPFLGCTVSLLLITGFKLAITLERNRWVLLYCGIVVFVFLGTYIIAGAPKLPMINMRNNSSKREYKKTFIGVTGRKTTKDEKRSFWKTAVGEENPSQSKKDDYWRGDK